MEEWIKVTDELPYDNETVLVTTSDYRIHIGFLIGYKWYLEHLGGLWVNKKDVLAWRHLPEAYKGYQENK